MPERVRLADRDQEEALRRGARPEGAEPVTASLADAVALRYVRSGLEGGPAGPGTSRAAASATAMAMQRLAGNRATVQALARPPRSNPLESLREDETQAEAATEGGAQSGETASSGQADSAVGTPAGGGQDGGGAGGTGQGGGSGGDGGGGGGIGGSAQPTGGTGGGRSAERAGRGAAGGSAGSDAGSKAKEMAEKGLGSTTGSDAGSKAKEMAEKGKAAAGGGGSAGSRAVEIAGGNASSGGVAGGSGAGANRKTPPPPIVAGAGGAGGSGGGAAAPGPAGGTAGGTTGVASGRAPAGPAPEAGPAGPATAPGPAPVPAPARAPATPTGPGGLPAPEAASTGVDWAKMLADYGPPARTVLELTRIVPGWGLLGGLAADSINFASDIAAIPNSENADLATGLIVFRNVVNVGNNGLGHILYVNQLIQDGLAGSVVGAEFVPLTAAANEALSTTKVVLDEVMMGTDIIVEVESLYQANHAPTSAEAEQWRALADGYAANILGDIVNLTLDVISLASAGAANTAPIQQGRQPLTLAAAFMRNATPNIISAVNGVLGVWLGSLITEGRTAFVGSPTDLRAQAAILDGAGLVVEAEGLQARTTYDGINVVIDALGAHADQQIAQINMVAEALSGGKSAFELIRDAVSGSLDDMAAKLAMVESLGVAASDGAANTAAIEAACETVLGALDEMVLPSVTLPSVDLGEGVVADAAEAVANEAAEAANGAITLAMSSVDGALDTAKDTIRGPVEAAQQQAGNLGEWLAILATQCAEMAGTLGGQISTFSEGLGRCTNIEQVIDLIIGQVSDLTGMPRVTVQEVRDAWNSVGPYIDQFIDLGTRMHGRATELRAHADLLESGGATEAGPTVAAPPPEPPPNPGATGTAAPPTAAVA
ncbi:MAG TPA: hypothetical protein VES19_16035 [Candidatus Limnocylindrales bacterium]|nr:hypothetical protein [Candidatus Limnocylindrales bacterium]